jgi:hypothetical protein
VMQAGANDQRRFRDRARRHDACGKEWTCGNSTGH